MKRLNIIQTANGWLVVSGEGENIQRLKDDAHNFYTFNSLDKAISHIRKTIKSWHSTSESPRHPSSHSKRWGGLVRDVDGLVIQLKHENDTLIARVKELEVELGKSSKLISNQGIEIMNLLDQLHQRDAAIVVAREALEKVCSCYDSKEIESFELKHAGYSAGEITMGDVVQCHHALSQIQACEVKR